MYVVSTDVWDVSIHKVVSRRLCVSEFQQTFRTQKTYGTRRIRSVMDGGLCVWKLYYTFRRVLEMFPYTKLVVGAFVLSRI